MSSSVEKKGEGDKPKVEGKLLPAAGLATPAAPPPVIPTSLLAPDEQRRLCIWVIGLIEVMKLWDVLAPHFADLPPALSSSLRVRGPISAAAWGVAELLGLSALSLLRIPGMSPSKKNIVFIVLVLVVWNVVCWFLADPRAFIPKVSMFGPVHLGEEGLFWGWLYLMRHIVGRLVFGPPEHISGTHKIRLLPYSTATLNPLSLTYCLPPGSREPIFVPVVFNNSAPEQVAYHIRSLVSQAYEIQTVNSHLMKKPVGFKLKIDEDDDGDDDNSDIAEIVARNNQLDLARLHSVRPSESLSIIPPDLASSESLLYITVTEPSIISLYSVTDRRGDRFNIAPHREAVVIECPTGGDFVDNNGKLILAPKQKQPAPERRCIGAEEVVKFQVRGVAPLKATWKRWRNGVPVSTGVVEGIDDESLDEVDGFRRERMSKTHTVPLRVEHSRDGDTKIALTSVVDALGNTYTPPGSSSTLQFQVMPQISAAFICPTSMKLLVNQTHNLPLVVTGASEPAELAYTFTSSMGVVSKRTLTVTDGQTQLEVSEPGTFMLQDIRGACPGTIVEPSSCSAQYIPAPTAEIAVKTLHECALDVGMTVNFNFFGESPFTVAYTEQRKGGSKQTIRHKFAKNENSLELRPTTEGEYEYHFFAVGDRNYHEAPLDYRVRQVVHPPASIEIVSATKVLNACSNKDVEVKLQTIGKDPLKLTYRRAWGRHSEDITVPLRSGAQTLTVPVPDDLMPGTGVAEKLFVTLMHVEDANGCIKRLPAGTIAVDIDRRLPTARLGRTERVVLKEGETTEVPLRLTGRGPWSVVYSLDGARQPPVKISQPTSELRFTAKGVYKLVSVEDENKCGGEVDAGEYIIDFKPRPGAALVESATIQRSGKAYRHTPMCAGEEDAVGVQFTGTAPFDISYLYSGAAAREHTLKSAQSVGILHLPSEAGLHRYAFRSVRDANYAKTGVDFSLHVQINARPTARISRPNRLTLCRDSPLNTDAKVRLTGAAPFSLTLGVRRPASSDVVPYTVRVNSDEWALALPQEIASEVGRYEVSVMSVSDASGCAFVFEDDAILSTSIEVVETARVVAVSHDEDMCVGDTLDFLLQGKAPWVVEYEWDGKRYTVTSSAARFSRAAESEGLFAIRSVALKDRTGAAQCKRDVAIERRVHPLPSVRIDEGVDQLREGDQPAVFAVHFRGTPPFTFSYTRSELVNGRPRVVETQTVTDIWADSYSISSSAPGDYEVTSVADKFCRYPPLGKSADA